MIRSPLLTQMITQIVLPYTRRELPGWGRLVSIANIRSPQVWSQVPVRRIRGKLHGYLMDLHVSDSVERWTYFLGRYYELSSQLLLRSLLHPDDLFLDVGANIGMITLFAASIVGPKGRVLAVEPNPRMRQRLVGHIELNNLEKIVDVYDFGLSDTEGTVVLSVPLDNPGQGTLAPVDSTTGWKPADQFEVQVHRGDDALQLPSMGALTIKIDVEGFECHVVRGLLNLIRARQPAIITEVEPKLLGQAGSNVHELFTLLMSLGYKGYYIGRGLSKRYWQNRLSLTEISEPGAIRTSDVLWIMPGTEHSQRLKSKAYV